MYNYGITSFLQAKSVEAKQAIVKFLEEENVTAFTHKNHNRVNEYVQANWIKFSSFIDKSIKSGKIKGNAVKLNTYFDEKRERDLKVKSEFQGVHLSNEERRILSLPSYHFGIIQSVLAKNGIEAPKKDQSFTSKRLQKLPYILLLRENNLVGNVILKINELPHQSTSLQ